MSKRGNERKDGRPALFWIGSVAGRAKAYIGILLLIQIVLGISGVAYALLLRSLVNHAVYGRQEGFWRAAVVFIALVLFQIALRAFHRQVEEWTRSSMENRFKARLFAALLDRDYAAVTRVNSGEWMNRLTSDTVVVADGLAQILPGAVGMAVKMAGALAAILFLEPQFLYILAPGGLLLILFTYGFRKVLKRLHKKIQEADGRLRVFFQERLGSLLIVRTFAQEQSAVDGAGRLMEAHRAARMKRSHFANFCNIGFGSAMNGAYVCGAIYCGYGILTGTMEYGNLMAILQLIGQVQSPFANITGYLPKYYAMIASAERLMEAERYAPDKSQAALPQEELQQFYRESFTGFGLRSVSFTYQPPVADCGGAAAMPVTLSDFSLDMKKGGYTALLGPSGCGKSTALKLLLCLYQPDAGSCYLSASDGERSLTSAWRGLFAYVPQGNQLLSGTIREILAFGDPEGMRQEGRLRRALEIACAAAFVDGLTQGIDTMLGERGTGLSEGQMQRIAIARAIFSDHPILLLDEATSSLDEVTEKQLLSNLRAMTDKTVVIVTHRPAVLSICDSCIDFGKIGDICHEERTNSF